MILLCPFFPVFFREHCLFYFVYTRTVNPCFLNKKWQTPSAPKKKNDKPPFYPLSTLLMLLFFCFFNFRTFWGYPVLNKKIYYISTLSKTLSRELPGYFCGDIQLLFQQKDPSVISEKQTNSISNKKFKKGYSSDNEEKHNNQPYHIKQRGEGRKGRQNQYAIEAQLEKLTSSAKGFQYSIIEGVWTRWGSVKAFCNSRNCVNWLDQKHNIGKSHQIQLNNSVYTPIKTWHDINSKGNVTLTTTGETEPMGCNL